MDTIRLSLNVLVEAFYRFNRDDGWAIASHIALSILMAMFPFLIVVTAIAGFVGSANLADEVARLMFAAWPRQVAGPIASEIHNVLTTDARRRPDAWARCSRSILPPAASKACASGSIAPTGCARSGAGGCCGWNRSATCWSARFALLALAFLVVLGPLIFKDRRPNMRRGSSRCSRISISRVSASARLVLAVALFILHMWLPAGRRGLSKVWPGIVATMVLWLACGFTFGHYLADFAYTYVTYYAGLASAMIALVFLYYSAWIFVYCGELNAAIARMRGARPPDSAHARLDCRLSSGSDAASSASSKLRRPVVAAR